ncbi:MAG: hypothetical protein ACK5MU_03110 [Candidatus Saccharimonadales bacterium]
MSLIVLKRMDYKVREQDGEETAPLAAFLGASSELCPSFGIGLIDERGQAMFWGLMIPHSLITAYRGMQILNEASVLQHGVICACYHAGQREMHESEAHYIADLETQIPDIENLRASLLEQKIPDEELDAMLMVCNSPKNGIDITIAELEIELAAGTISRTAGVEKAMQIEQEEQARRDKNTEISEQALPAEQSFAGFCEEAGVKYLCQTPIGLYGWDWGHEDLADVDREIVFAGLHYGSVKGVYCTEFPEKSKSLGSFGHPVISINNGEENIAIEFAQYTEGAMHVYLCGVDCFGENRDRGLVRLDELRKMNPKMVGVTQVIETGDVDNPVRNYISMPIYRGKKPIFGFLTKIFK